MTQIIGGRPWAGGISGPGEARTATEGLMRTPRSKSAARSASAGEQLGLLLLELLVGKRAFLVQLSELLELLHRFGAERS